jgi:AcrR family transcriptional regulator
VEVHFHLDVECHILALVSVEVAPRRPAHPAEGLRSRKKQKTRLAIEDAALALFAEQGFEATTVEQIVERAEVSMTTFFRYFPSKADVVLTNWGEGLPELHHAITERPVGEPDLLAVRRAIEQEWVASIDPDRTVRVARAVASSPLLRGLSFQVGERWLASVSSALATRHGLVAPDRRCTLTARVALETWADAVETWITRGAEADLDEAVAQGFDLVAELAHRWTEGRGE